MPNLPAPAGASSDVLDVITAERHPLDDVLEQAIDAWLDNPSSAVCEGAVIRATLADPQHRWLVTAWLQEAGVS